MRLAQFIPGQVISGNDPQAARLEASGPRWKMGSRNSLNLCPRFALKAVGTDEA